MAVTSDRNLTTAPRSRTWLGLRALAVLVEPHRWHGAATIARGPSPGGCRSTDEHPRTCLTSPVFPEMCLLSAFFLTASVDLA